MRRHLERAAASGRAAVIGACVLGVLLSGPASAACLGPADAATFEVVALKTEMMVTALSCGLNRSYDDAVRRFRPQFAARDRALAAYFRRTDGRRGQARHDAYLTQMANARSQAQGRDGDDGCARGQALFGEVAALRSDADLAKLAAAKAYSQPYAMAACGGRALPVQDPERTRPAEAAPAAPRSGVARFDPSAGRGTPVPGFDPARPR